MNEERKLPADSPAPSPEGPLDRWRSFDTAPKDGSEILAYRKDAGTLVVHFVSPADAIGGDDHEPAWFTICGDDLSSDLPTLWTPMPSPKAATGAPVEAAPVGEMLHAVRKVMMLDASYERSPIGEAQDILRDVWERAEKIAMPNDEAEVPAQGAEDHDWEARLVFVQRRIDQGIHTRAELYCKEAIEEIASLRSQLEKESNKYQALATEYHAIRAASREGFSDEENVANPTTTGKIQLMRTQRDDLKSKLEQARADHDLDTDRLEWLADEVTELWFDGRQFDVTQDAEVLRREIDAAARKHLSQLRTKLEAIDSARAQGEPAKEGFSRSKNESSKSTSPKSGSVRK